MFIPDKNELAWSAGFFDGEGCFSTTLQVPQNGKTYRYPRACITQSSKEGKDLLTRFQLAVGGVGTIFGPYKHQKPHWKVRYQWHANGFEKTQAVLTLLWSNLGRQKRNAAMRVLRGD